MSGSAGIFDAAFAITVGIEGGYVDNPADPGGETKFGISRRSYPTLDIANLTEDDAKAIYQRDYWTPSGAAYCPAALAPLVFDCAVNNGVQRAAVLLQQALGVTADGVIGPQTQAALGRISDPVNMVALFHGARIEFMCGLSDWSTFGKGWARRLAQLPFQAAQVAASTGTLPTLTLV